MPIKDFYTQEDPLVVFKWVRNDGGAPWGNGKWDLPKDGQRGAIKSIGKDEPIMCAYGIHGYADFASMLVGLWSGRLFVAELWGKVICWQGEKVVAQSGRLCYELALASDPTEWYYDALHKIKQSYWQDNRRHGTDERRESLLVELHARFVKIQANQPPATLVESLTRK